MGITQSRPRGEAPLHIQLKVLTVRLMQDLGANPIWSVIKLVFGAGFVIAYSGALGGSPAVLRETGGHYLAFIVPSGILIATFTGATGGYMLARDIEDGYLGRLLTMPLSRTLVALAPMSVGALYALIQAAAVLMVGGALGAVPRTGVPGAVGILVIASLWGMGITGCITTAALATRNAEMTRLVDVCTFSLFVFLAPILLPRPYLAAWLRPIASANPATYVLEGMRTLMLTGWHVSSLLDALVAAGGFDLAVLATAAAVARHWARRPPTT